MKQKIKKFIEKRCSVISEDFLIKWQTGSVVIFTGAGMSTESGLPDFRSGKGLWKQFDPMRLATVQAMKNNYDEFHAFYSLRLQQAIDVKPNQGHCILSDWEKRGWIKSVITQNVDGLHQAAGSKNVIELHGRLGNIRCIYCDEKSSERNFLEKAPCSHCGGRLRPGVVLFGENLPVLAFESAQADSRNAQIFLALGSSLQVSPANYLPQEAKQKGAFLGLCNRDQTLLDSIFDIRSRANITDFLIELNEKLIAIN